MTNPTERNAAGAPLVERMRGIALRSLPRMYRPETKRFGWCLRRNGGDIALEGNCLRYTAITAIGLATEAQSAAEAALHGGSLADLCDDMIREAPRVENLGDAALLYWAAIANGREQAPSARDRMLQLLGQARNPYTVELSWCLTALSLDADAPRSQRDQTAAALLAAFSSRSRAFPHHIGLTGGVRGHVSCFADMVYPIQALSHYHGVSGNRSALQAAEACAELICERMGAAGQWWWHYDYRTGEVVEGYPVYAVHQDAMAPMALLILGEVGGRDFSREIRLGLDWLETSPELNGRSLIDAKNDLIWRKVARREPNKLVRKIRAATTRVVPGWRLGGLDAMFPPGTVDWETRPYHMGWLLHAFTPTRLARGWSEAAQ